MGIEPTNKGFADHLSSQCKYLFLKDLNPSASFLGPSLGPTCRSCGSWDIRARECQKASEGGRCCNAGSQRDSQLQDPLY